MQYKRAILVTLLVVLALALAAMVAYAAHLNRTAPRKPPSSRRESLPVPPPAHDPLLKPPWAFSRPRAGRSPPPSGPQT
jgi:hypothetical protein